MGASIKVLLCVGVFFCFLLYVCVMGRGSKWLLQKISIQQQPDLLPSTGRPWSIFTLLAVSVALDGGPTRFLISAAMVINACSTLVAFLADVSRNGIPSWLAYS